jgi:50S ribosomal subunit-associated GTPase HflX
MPMSDEQIKEQIFYLETRIERQRAIIEGLEADGYGGEVIRRSRSLLKQMIADLDQFLVQLREARQINVKKNEQKISSSASDASRQNSIDR